jgi:hypothetical protein
MTNIYVRDVPPGTLEILKKAAQTDGRSLNAEVLRLLNQEAEYLRRSQDFLANVKPRKPRVPVDLEALIREDRESRSEGPG